MTHLFAGATLVHEGRVETADLLISGDRIVAVGPDLRSGANPAVADTANQATLHDCAGLHLLPGMIDDQVHFREPGLTHKAEIATESRAAVSGGITTFMEMPNTVPQALTQELLQDKYDRAAEVSPANYSFFMGASNGNLDEVLKTDPKRVCGVKVFMGSSTGDMLVDDAAVLEGIFKECPMLIATHCEDEATIRANAANARQQFGDDVPIAQHPIIRSAEACYRSSSRAVSSRRDASSPAPSPAFTLGAAARGSCSISGPFSRRRRLPKHRETTLQSAAAAPAAPPFPG